MDLLCDWTIGPMLFRMGHTVRFLALLILVGCGDSGRDPSTLDAGSDAAADASDPPPLDASWALGEGTRSGVVSCWLRCSDGEGTPARECRGGEQETVDAFGAEWAAAELAKVADAGARCWTQCLDVPLEVLPADPSEYPACSADVGPGA